MKAREARTALFPTNKVWPQRQLNFENEVEDEDNVLLEGPEIWLTIATYRPAGYMYWTRC
jgi:hypothetical protein